MKPAVPYCPYLIKRLKDPQYAIGYLNACLEYEDEETFLLALHDVAVAQGGIRILAKKSGLNREHLFRMLSKKGNPRLESLRQLADALGLRIVFAAKQTAKLRRAA